MCWPKTCWPWTWRRCTGEHSDYRRAAKRCARYQGSGLGRMLLHDASLRALAIAESLGAKALVVDPADEAAAAFYERNGFEKIPGMERLFVPLKGRDG